MKGGILLLCLYINVVSFSVVNIDPSLLLFTKPKLGGDIHRSLPLNFIISLQNGPSSFYLKEWTVLETGPYNYIYIYTSPNSNACKYALKLIRLACRLLWVHLPVLLPMLVVDAVNGRVNFSPASPRLSTRLAGQRAFSFFYHFI